MQLRTMDAGFLNSVANHPEVRLWLGGVGPLDLTDVLADANNYAFQNESGGLVYEKIDAGLYEVHSLFLPEGRGASAFNLMDESLRYMFVQTECQEIVTKVPDDNSAALGAARAKGFATSFRLETGWTTPEGLRVGMAIMRLPLSKWIGKDDLVEAKGRWFHERLEELTNNAIPVHYDEAAHNRAVGASIMMAQAGNVLKAIGSYNVWAHIAQYPLIKPLSLIPLIIDMDQAVIEFKGNDMEILKCQLG